MIFCVIIRFDCRLDNKKKSITGVIAKLLFLERSNREISTLQTNRKIKFIMNLFKWSSTADLIIYIISHFTYILHSDHILPFQLQCYNIFIKTKSF